MAKKILFGTVAGLVVLLLGGWLVYGVVLKGTMEEWAQAAGDCMHTEPDMVTILVATLIQALLFALILDKFKANTLTAGAIAAGWITFLVALMYDLWLMAAFDFFTASVLPVDVVANTVVAILGGAAIGFTYSKVR
jgi:hypothetical protein